MDTAATNDASALGSGTASITSMVMVRPGGSDPVSAALCGTAGRAPGKLTRPLGSAPAAGASRAAATSAPAASMVTEAARHRPRRVHVVGFFVTRVGGARFGTGRPRLIGHPGADGGAR